MPEDITVTLRDLAHEATHQCPVCGTSSSLLSSAANEIERLRSRGYNLSKVVLDAFYLTSVLDRLAWQQVAKNALDAWKEVSNDQ